MKSKYLIVPAILALAIARPSRPPVVVTQTSIQPPDTIEGIAAAKRAAALHADQKYAEAVQTFDSASIRLPQIGDWLQIFAASSASFLGDTAEVTRRLESADSMTLEEWAWRLRARAYNKAGSPERALEIASTATESGTPGKRAAAWYVVAELQRDRGNAAAQRAALVRALEVASVSEATLDAARVLAQFDDLTLHERLLAGRALMRNGEVSLGAKTLRSFVEASSDADLRDEVRYEIGRAMFNTGEYAAAQRDLSRIGATHSRKADAQFLIGRSQYRSRKTREGLATFRAVATKFPKSDAATRALYFLGDLAQDANRGADAKRYFEQTAARYAMGGDEPALAMMRLGSMQYVQKKYADAERTFETYRKRYSSGVEYERATFWSAQAARAAGKEDVANQRLKEINNLDSFSYYAVRAAELLDDSPIDGVIKGPSPDTVVQPEVDKALARWHLLREIGWNDAAAFELRRLRENVADNKLALYAIAEGLNQRGHASAGISLGSEILRMNGKMDDRLLRILYPMPYEEIIEKEARERGIDPYFVAALMRQESRFNPRAVSPAGAIGLMQIMPATGRQLGGVDRTALMDPHTNIRLGTRFLADLIRSYGSRTDAVLAAYNAGPSRMARWRRFPEYASPDLFAERIPFDETRGYVKVVRVNTSIYRALYND